MAFLKNYQQESVDALRAYFQRCREVGAKAAFEEDPARGAYREPADLPGMPYVCLKVPTGGGKTAIAAWSVRPMLEVMGQREASPVLWLAPSTKIVEQTIDALRDRRHPYRLELERAFEGRLTVCDIKSALYLRRSWLESECVVIVTTIQALRSQDTEGRKVYEANGELKHHFEGLTPQQRETLAKLAAEGEDPTKPSLANVLRIHRPAVVVDEAHNARTDLSFETLRRFAPSCVLELTATPAADSNVLHQVSAARLKAAHMIKLPVLLRAKKLGGDAIDAAVQKRDELNELARAERETHGYVRPIVLYQAETGKKDLNVHGVKKLLVEKLGVVEEKVAICTGSIDELPDLPIDHEDNPIEHIITVQKLREGWDCPFAYILCSVGNLGSSTAVEQLLGRVLRMPHATRRGHEDLNQAYCYARSEDFQHAARDLESALVENCGFTPHEARKALRPEGPAQPGLHDGMDAPVSIDAAGGFEPDRLPAELQKRVQATPRSGGGHTVTWTGGAMTEAEETALAPAFTDARDALAPRRLNRRSWRQDDAPASLGLSFAVPQLAVREDGQWSLLEDQPIDNGWSLGDVSPELTDAEFKPSTGDKRYAKLDVNQMGAAYASFFEDFDQQLLRFETSDRNTPALLANWLDARIRERGLTATVKRDFLLRAVLHQVEKKERPINVLDRNRFTLKDALEAKIRAAKLHAEAEAYQLLLNSDDVGVDPGCRFHFPAIYGIDKLCTATFEWKKHYYPEVGDLNGDELEVAKFLDSHPAVRHWVRNPEGEHHLADGFSLRKAHGHFFPDFVAELHGGAQLVVEFKGAHLEGTPDSEEKKRVGQMWAAADAGRLGFVWATASNGWQNAVETEMERLGANA